MTQEQTKTQTQDIVLNEALAALYRCRPSNANIMHAILLLERALRYNAWLRAEPLDGLERRRGVERRRA